jgi:hypothetical protein
MLTKKTTIITTILTNQEELKKKYNVMENLATQSLSKET